jgi:thymidylate kinase
MITIFEGPDGGGKTTLALRLSMRSDNGMYFHAGFNDALEPAMPEYHESILDQAAINSKELGTYVYLDRLWPSEFAYSRAIRPARYAELIRRGWFKHMYEQCQKLGVLYVFCYDESSELRYVTNPGNDHYNEDQYAEILNGYRIWMEQFPATVYHYHCGVTKVVDVESAIYNAADKLP